jgi:bifunctional pyridoxal-dependent enzyme with beta-cystathionase and maltose regulon repressor activities
MENRTVSEWCEEFNLNIICDNEWFFVVKEDQKDPTIMSLSLTWNHNIFMDFETKLLNSAAVAVCRFLLHPATSS